MEKKVGIITWCDNNGPTNYGQILQCYGMQNTFIKLGLKPVTILYRKKRDDDFIKYKFKISALNDIYELLYKVFIIEKTYNRRIHQFRKFIKERINTTDQCYDKADLDRVSKDCKFLVCGSDQIWNPLWYDSHFFLDFGAKKKRKIAYASSGILVEDEETQETYRKMSGLIEKIDRVSVREPESVEILAKYTDKNVEVVLDPTLLMSSEDWDKIAAKRLIEDKYIFCYVMGELRPHRLVLKSLMKKYNVDKIVFIPSNVVENSLKFAVPFESAGPAEFVSLIKYAQAVCTDSFHGTALSVVYKKQFYTLKRVQEECYKWANFSRIENILKKFHIKNRTLNCVKDIRKATDIKYDQIQKYVDKEVSNSIGFLKKSIYNG